MNLQSLLIDPWPREISAAAEKFHQGHLVEDVRLLYMGSPQSPATSFTSENTEPDDGRLLRPLILPQSHAYRYGIITSATCDVAEAGDHKNPFFQVSPVFDISGNLRPGQEKPLIEGRFGDFVYLSQQPIPDGLWVADLRVSIPIEKGALVGRVPIDAFLTEEDRIAFAARLARRVSRAALSEDLHDLVVSSLNDWIKKKEGDIRNAGSGAFTDVERVALNIIGDRLHPRSVQVVVFEETRLEKEDRAVWREWRHKSRNILKNAHIKLDPCIFRTLAKMPVREYERLVPLSIPALGRTAHW
ncbi:hypothetical protein ACIRQQ_48060 [Streptomyces fuscichromogenes]|uniref:hypothetical protein n=1 Tax=Streptomyces fuscichromogenes TaxID=1324013 RepID=UPI00382353C3